MDASATCELRFESRLVAFKPSRLSSESSVPDMGSYIFASIVVESSVQRKRFLMNPFESLQGPKMPGMCHSQVPHVRTVHIKTVLSGGQPNL